MDKIYLLVYTSASGKNLNIGAYLDKETAVKDFPNYIKRYFGEINADDIEYDPDYESLPWYATPNKGEMYVQIVDVKRGE